MRRSEERAARNEVTFRRANDKIDAKRRELDVRSPTPYLCECEDESCTELIRLTAAEYEAARSTPTRFVISRGHDHRGEVVEQGSDYVLVEKSGVGGRIAEKTAE